MAIFYCSSQYAYGRTKIVVSQSDDLVSVFAKKNTRFIIKEDIDLGRKKVTIGDGGVLVFRGGSLANGTVVGNLTHIKAGNYEIFKRGYTRYRAYVRVGSKESTPPSLQKEYHNCLIIEGTWNNKKCGTNWTGLLNNSNEDVMLAIKNYVALHSEGANVKLPTINAYGYEMTKLQGNHAIDLNYSTISYPDDLRVWEDVSIKLPEGATPCSLESGYGLISLSNNTKLSNLTLDGKSTKRQDEKVRLGVSCLVSIGCSKNVTLENVKIFNALGPGMTAQAGSKDITFRNCTFSNIGEHVLYSHQYQGYCHFEGCTFDTWDSERISVYRNGLNYVYNYSPTINAAGIPYDEIYQFDLTFNRCTFVNPERITSQGRTLGGFITGNFPIIVNVVNSKFIGTMPAFNPGGGSTPTEALGKPYKMVVRDCDGAPYVYPSKANYNILTEFYNCTNLPFRTVFAKRYENCELELDLYEDNTENVSTSFYDEFKEPLVITNCSFYDNGHNVTINHPLLHRPVLFYDCTFRSNISSNKSYELLNVKDSISSVTFEKCDIELPFYRLVSDNKLVGLLTIKNTVLSSLDSYSSTSKIDCVKFEGNKKL